MTVSRKRGKNTEYAHAKILGGERVGNTGKASYDVDAGWLAVESKHRSILPKWLTRAMAQAKQTATPDQLPIVIIHLHGQRHDDDIVMLRLKDFVDWFGSVSDYEE